MDLNKVITEGLKFSLFEFKNDKKLIKYLTILFLVYLISALIIYGFFGATLSGIESGVEPGIEQIGSLFLLFGVIGLPTFIIITIISFLIIRQGLLIEKKKAIDLDIVNYIKFLLMGIATAIVAFLSIYNLKFLTILLVGFLLLIIGFIGSAINPFIGGALIMIGIILFIAYMFVVIYNSIRLALTDITFIESGSITDALRKSWNITKGNVLNLVIALILFGIIISIISMIFQIPVFIYSFIIGFSQGLSGGTFNEALLYVDPIYIVLSIPIYFVSSYSILASYLFLIKIYKFLGK